ncbi:hypothetical protein CRE_08735 [Caenorhabditis remanei]|uniref:G-protein coupled receptors family 1 profile domain-containing protein n=1 Tax=Caenorhabditis remanei TaxID=31234 RepID=E3LJM3_CAERE|nr:hypothetical protein CRE_08735 [Caenorhabditis remanei]
MFFTEVNHFRSTENPGQLNCNPRDISRDECVRSINYLSYLSVPIICQNLVSFLNFWTQVVAIWMVYSRRRFQKGPFFVLLIVLASSVIFRNIMSIIIIYFVSRVPMFSDAYKRSLLISLYLDYISNYFSMVLIFVMSLNRCLIFVKLQWSNMIFDGNRIVYPIVVSLVLSVIGATGTIATSGITREYNQLIGFLDFGQPKGLKTIINRIFILFPFGSVICYLTLFYYLRQKKKELLSNPAPNNKNPKNRGEQKVFIQLLITIVFYGIMAIISEITSLWTEAETQVKLIAVLNVFNYLPEMSLPFLLIVNNIRVNRRVSIFVTRSKSNSQIVIPLKAQTK